MENDKDLLYHRMLCSPLLCDKVAYLDYILSFYKDVSNALEKVKHKSVFRKQMSTTILMMYSKGKTMSNLIHGSYSDNKNIERDYLDHTILFTLVRAAYEQLCFFELVYIIPDTEEKRTIMENVYVAAGIVNRQKTFSEETRLQYKEVTDEDRRDIENCKKVIFNTHLFQSLTDIEQKDFEKTLFKKGEYQIVFNEDGKFIKLVGWNDVRKYCRLNTDSLDGIYKYACNMAHPSYWGLIQFCDAYNEGCEEKLTYTAVMQMTGIISVFIMDFIDAFSEIKYVYSYLDEASKYMIRAYNECFRNKSTN